MNTLTLRNVDYLHIVAVLLLFALSLASANVMADNDEIDIDRASWSDRRDRLSVEGGKAPRNATVTIRYGEKGDNGAVIGSTTADGDGDWEFRISDIDPVPCDVTAESGRDDDDKEVRRAPGSCNNDGGAPPPAAQCSDGIDNDGDNLVDLADPGCTDANDNDETDAPPPPVAQCADGIDNDGDNLVDLADPGCTDANVNDETDAPPPPVVQCADGIDNDGDNLVDLADPGCANANDDDETNLPPAPVPNVSINSTSANGIPGGTAVAEQPFTGLSSHVLLSINDLGMHCGDFDTRISSILPPFNVTHTHVIQRGNKPVILTPTDGIEVVYSASSNPNDPILTGINSDGSGPVYSSMLADGSVYKTNFLDGARSAYDPFYPSDVLPLFYGPLANIVDLGLPMPNVERFYLGDGFLAAEQQEMPGVAAPYSLNDPLTTKTFTADQPFFTTFPFGYTSHGVNWFEQAGIPLAAFDDFGRENPWALMRVQAKAGGQTLASLDTVLPISGEANCGFCHGDPADGGNGVATQALIDAGIAVLSSIDDPEHGAVPDEVSKEYAADMNLVRLHDLRHGSGLGANAKYTPDLEAQAPVVCQKCHYTPALDLAQFGPLGPENDATLTVNLDSGPFLINSLANGRDQVKHKSMSNVMHSHHGQVTDANGNNLFPTMPPAVDSNGNLRDPVAAKDILQQTCYQCHPGRRTDCLRGAMATGGMLCQDCHGDMDAVGNDFTRNVTLATPGAFELGPDFYDPNSPTPRVPWANEPGCGSCHTGDAMDNMHADADTLGDPQDGIRLMQAFKIGDAKATPIVPTNKRFAENVITAADNPNDPAAIGNPMLYRVSTGHQGVFCEACHGATHGIWPNGNPNANDNVAAIQLQGHSGTVAECDVCHTDINALGSDGSNASMQGPHGMHTVGDTTVFADGGHKENMNGNACRACHGQNGEGTALSRTSADRDFTGMKDGGPVAAGTPVTCTMCHGNEL